MPETRPAFPAARRLCSPAYRRANDVPRSMTEPIGRSAIDEEGTARCARSPVRHRTARAGPLRPGVRARRLRCRLRRDPLRRRDPRDRRPGADRAAQPRPPRRLGRRAGLRRRGGHPHPGPGRLPARASRRSRCPTRVRTPSAPRSCRTTTPRRRPPGRRSRRSPPRRACRSSAGARSRPRRRCSAAPRAGVMPRFRQLFVSAADGGVFGMRAGADGVLPAEAGRARGRRLLPVAVGPHPRLQGHAHDRAAGAVLPRPVRPAVRHRAGAGALPVLDEHLPVLAAGPPVPADRAQRRDQHRQGQPELDARPREPAGQRRDPRRPRRGCCRSARRARATRPPSTRCSSCCTSAAGRCRTRC